MADYHKDYAFLMDNHHPGQADIIAGAIAKLQFPTANQSFMYVDIGSHEGKLTGLVLRDLSRRYDLVRAYCIEPDEETFQLLQANLNEPRVSSHNTNFQTWLGDNSDRLANSVDLVVNSHTFYHYPEESWAGLIGGTDRLLSGDGIHTIAIDSVTSSHNQLKPLIDGKMPGKRHDAFGDYLTGNSLDSYFKANGITYTKSVLPSPIDFEDNSQVFDGVCHMLGFIMRYDPDDIKKHVAKEVEEFIVGHKKGQKIVFPRDMDFFIIPKQDGSPNP